MAQIAVNNDFKNQRDFVNILMNAYKDVQGDEQGNKRLAYLAKSRVYQTIFGGVYNVITTYKLMPEFSELNKEYQDELWGIAAEFMPNAEVEDQFRYIQALIGFNYLLNN